MLTGGSVCSGIGGLDRGLHRAGVRVRWFCEQQPYRRRVLGRHWPGVPCAVDLTTLNAASLEPVDLLAGGTPCPDFSHAKAGRRGLEGDKSRLFWDFARIRNALSPRWTIWENVDGALTTNQGLDFALVLGAFVGADIHVPAGGWPSAGVVTGPWGGAVWRVLNAQHFGTPQRRHRVFVVGVLGGPCPPEILLEPASRSGDSATCNQAPEDIARALGERVAGALGSYSGRGGLTRSQVVDGHGAYVAAGEPVVSVFRKAQKAHHDEDCERWEEADIAPTLGASGGNGNAALVVPRVARAVNGKWRSQEDVDTLLVLVSEVASTLTGYTGRAGRANTDDYNLIAYALRSNGSNARATARETEIGRALLRAGAKAGAGTTEETVVLELGGVRRLTPTECERLQGLPDGWTIPWGHSLADAPAWHEEGQSSATPWDPPDRLDTPRRSGCGDAVNAVVAEWIGRRIVSWEASRSDGVHARPRALGETRGEAPIIKKTR